jgi:hypothetical protein
MRITKDMQQCDRCSADETIKWAKPLESVTLFRKSVNGGRALDLCALCLRDLHAFADEKIRRT